MKYLVEIRGENFLIHIEGKKRKIGFRVKRLVQAISEHEAGQLALYQIGGDLRDMVLNDKDDAPEMLIREVRVHSGDLPEDLNSFQWFEEEPCSKGTFLKE